MRLETSYADATLALQAGAMYVLLTGAKKNLGDYLITDRATRLLSRYKPGHEFVTAPSWQELDRSLLAEARGVIVLGGPGYQPKLYPKVYPLLPNLADIGVPLTFLGMGWKGIPGDEATLESYRFSRPSQQALKYVSENTPWLGCRDLLTARVLERHGFDNTLMTGCPVWYHLPSIGRAMRLPKTVERLLYTPAQHPIFADQSIELLTALSELFPKAERICSFHRGIDEESEWTSETERANHRRIADAATRAGFHVENVSGALENVDFYDTCDFHVGYRVHAHIQLLSQRLPSLLLHEDGRGIGASEALELRGVDAFVRSPTGTVKQWLPPRGTFSRAQRLLSRLGPDYTAAPHAVQRVRSLIRNDLATGFGRYGGVGARIDAHLPVMQRFIEAIPS